MGGEMTRPSDVKPREGEQAGTRAESFKVGEPLPEIRFIVTPDIVREYITAIDSTPELYRVGDRLAAPPNVLAVYLLAILYRRYPPTQGIILTQQRWRWHQPIWADESTPIVADGDVLGREMRRGKYFVRWEGRFRRADHGTAVASAVNTMYVPE